MPEVQYIHSSMYGTYKIPCTVIAKEQNSFLISYIDPISNDKISKIVISKDLVFPEFSSLVL